MSDATEGRTVAAVHKPCGGVVLHLDYIPLAAEQMHAAKARLPDGTPLVAGQIVVCPRCERPLVLSELVYGGVVERNSHG